MWGMTLESVAAVPPRRYFYSTPPPGGHERTKSQGELMARAHARHILVDNEVVCDDLKQQITDGADFAEIARNHSLCPSKSKGGDLGEFGPGQMVPEFDQAAFSGEVGEVQGPIQTQFGYHLLEVINRED